MDPLRGSGSAEYRKILNTLKGWFHISLSLLIHNGIMQRGMAMFLKKVEGPRSVTLADGSVMTRADLPPPTTQRWVASRKAAVVRGVLYGLITKTEALQRYSLSDDEFMEWVNAISAHGEEALKVTSLKKYRQPTGGVE